MKNTLVISILACLFLGSCKPSFDPIDYGHDACANCKMTILDKRYASEFLTKKGKSYKFDDISCLRKYLNDKHIPESDLMIFVADYNNPGATFLNARLAIYLHDKMFKSPMNGNFAAFVNKENAVTFKDSLKTDLIEWGGVN